MQADTDPQQDADTPVDDAEEASSTEGFREKTARNLLLAEVSGRVRQGGNWQKRIPVKAVFLSRFIYKNPVALDMKPSLQGRL
jgi:hypothetical protein